MKTRRREKKRRKKGEEKQENEKERMKKKKRKRWKRIFLILVFYVVMPPPFLRDFPQVLPFIWWPWRRVLFYFHRPTPYSAHLTFYNPGIPTMAVVF